MEETKKTDYEFHATKYNLCIFVANTSIKGCCIKSYCVETRFRCIKTYDKQRKVKFSFSFVRVNMIIVRFSLNSKCTWRLQIF